MLEALALALLLLPGAVRAQLINRNDYGAGLTVAVYQYDDTQSKEIAPVTALKQTTATPQEEIAYLTQTFGLEGLKLRHLRTIGLKEGESFNDSEPLNERPLTLLIRPRAITPQEVRLDLTATYASQPLLEVREIAIANYETVMLRGGRGDFGVREFIGPGGTETVPEKRALLITITASVVPTRGLQNRPSDLSRLTDEFGTRIALKEGDVFVMPSIANRVAPRFLTGREPKGSITLEGIVTPEGRVTNVRVLDTPDPAYNAKAIEAFRQYRFHPARLNGRPTYATFRETIVFGKPALPEQQ
jgi:TonB family protein